MLLCNRTLAHGTVLGAVNRPVISLQNSLSLVVGSASNDAAHDIVVKTPRRQETHLARALIQVLCGLTVAATPDFKRAIELGFARFAQGASHQFGRQTFGL